MDSIELAAIDIIAYIKNNDLPSDGFNYNVAKMKVAPHFNPNKSGYELLTSKGVEIVVNDSLRMAISDLYESYYPYYAQYEKERITFKSNIIQPYFQSQLRITEKLTLNAGLHTQYSTLNEQFVLEPRAAVNYSLFPNHTINLGYGIHQQSVPLPLLSLNEPIGANVCPLPSLTHANASSHKKMC